MKLKESVSISDGNMKDAGVNTSLPPVISCPNCSSCRKKCYGNKSYNMYPSVKRAWDSNFEIAKNNLEKYKTDVNSNLQKRRKKVKFFRIHVSGDFFSQEYYNAWIQIARENPETVFFAFTKNFDLTFGKLPDNFKILISAFQGMDDINIKKINKLSKKFPVAEAGDIEIKTITRRFQCHGNCTECGFVCASLRNGEAVHFDLH